MVKFARGTVLFWLVGMICTFNVAAMPAPEGGTDNFGVARWVDSGHVYIQARR